MKKAVLVFSLLCFASHTKCYDNLRPKESGSKSNWTGYVGPQEGRKDADKIKNLPRQPPHVNFSQYSGYVTVDPEAGRALFYYLAEAEINPADKPLLLWLNGGPGCSSMGGGAMTELGPFRVKPDGKTLWYNEYAWNKAANVLFLESPAGVGFSYSKNSSDYVTGDEQTAADSYTFLVNWFKRFPEYEKRPFFIAGESYAGHYIPQLAELILDYKKNMKLITINLKGIAVGNALINDADANAGAFDYWWTHALVSDETYKGIIRHCDFYSEANFTKPCRSYIDKAKWEIGNINRNDIYAPLCMNSSSGTSGISSFDPCSMNYVHTYLNANDVQKALHVSVDGITRPWQMCSITINGNWTDRPATVIPVIKKLMGSGIIRVLIYSGDTDGAIPVTATKYSLHKLTSESAIKTQWSAWYNKDEVGGYLVEYDGLTFWTVRGSGHMVPSYQPERALVLFESFLQGKLPT